MSNQFLGGAWKAWLAGILIALAAIPETREVIQLGFDRFGVHPTVAGFLFAVAGAAVVWAKANKT